MQVRNGPMGPVDWSVTRAACVGLTGPSGAGKTLLLRAIVDLDPHEGSVLLDGIDSLRVPPAQWRRRIGFLPSESAWWAEHVGEHFGRIDARAWVDLGFEPDVADWEVQRMSTGERQRLALLRLLQNGPEVLLLDEPTANLDRANTERVEHLIADYCARVQATVVWVTHDRDQIGRLAGQAWHLDRTGLRPMESS